MRSGRKSKYDPTTFPALGRELAEQGLIDSEIASRLNISLSSYYLYVSRFSEFSEAVKAGKAIIDAKVEKKLLSLCLGGKEETVEAFIDKENHLIKARKTITECPPNTRAIMFWLKNRKPQAWREKQVIEPASPLEVPTGLNKEDLDLLWAEFSAGTILES
jgi:hypothetical protein